MKKAQGISLNVIIIAAIALLVLVILSVIFMGRMGIFGEETAGTRYCEDTLEGTCGGVGTTTDADGNTIDVANACSTLGAGYTKVNVCDSGQGNCCKKVA
jgi:hypothetical protein